MPATPIAAISLRFTRHPLLRNALHTHALAVTLTSAQQLGGLGPGFR